MTPELVGAVAALIRQTLEIVSSQLRPHDFTKRHQTSKKCTQATYWNLSCASEHSLGMVYPLSHDSITLSHSMLSSCVALTKVSVSHELLETFVPAAAMVSSSSGCVGGLEKMRAGAS